MQVVVTSVGEFHARNTAYQCERLGILKKYITTCKVYSRVSKKKTLYLPLLDRLYWHVPRLGIDQQKFNFYVRKNFADYVFSKNINGCDIFHAITSLTPKAAWAAKDCGKIFIVDRGIAHSNQLSKLLNEEYIYWGVRRPISNRFEKYVEGKTNEEFETADYILVPSEFVVNTFKEEGYDISKIRYLPYGYDESIFDSLQGTNQLKRPESMFRLVFAGSVCLRKGVHYLIQAFKELKLPNAELIFLGGIYPEIKSFLKNIPDNIRLMGNFPHHKLAEYYAQCSVYVFPSLAEGSSLSIYEAMTCGLPIITTFNSGSVVRDGQDGFIIPIRDVEALKEKILYFYENQERVEEMGQSARQWVQNFTWDKYGERLLDIYEEMLAEKRGDQGGIIRSKVNW